MILLVSNQRDLTTDYIVRELKIRGLAYKRLNTESLVKLNCSIGFNCADDWSIGSIKGNEVTSAYFRRPSLVSIRHPSLTEEETEYLCLEWMSFLKSIYYRLEGKWFSSPTHIALAEDKPRQLLVASSLGFKIPIGVISNDVYDVISRTRNDGLIVKPLRQALLKGGQEKVIFTSRIPKLSNEHKTAISYSPSIYQQEIKKKFDVRVTVVGDKVFPVAIWSQNNTESEVDWRNGGRIDLLHEKIELPSELEKKCVMLTQELNLRFGAIDLICDLDEEFWFLEINPNGQWAWIENQTKLPIASAIVDELLMISEANNEH